MGMFCKNILSVKFATSLLALLAGDDNHCLLFLMPTICAYQKLITINTWVPLKILRLGQNFCTSKKLLKYWANICSAQGANCSAQGANCLTQGANEFMKSTPGLLFLNLNFQPRLSTEREVVLDDVSFETTGQYRCEVSGDAPMFQTASTEGILYVVGKNFCF